MEPRRRSDTGHTNEPAFQVVGFHVEGQSPSPAPPSLLADSLRKVTSGSPTPVIIPPTFQRDSTLSRAEGSNKLTQPLGSGDYNPVSRTSSGLSAVQGGPGNSTASTSTAVTTAPLSSSIHLRTSASSILDNDIAAANAAEQPAAASSSHAADRGAIAQDPPQDASRAAKPSTASTSATPETAVQPQQPGSAKGKGGSEQQVSAKPQLTRAERRAIQDAQRAAKAAARGEGGAESKSKAGDKATDGKGPKIDGAKGGKAAPGADKPELVKSSSQRASLTGEGKSGPGLSGAGPSGTAQGTAAAAGPAGAGKAGGGGGGGGERRQDRGLSLTSREMFAHLQQYHRMREADVLRHREAAGVHPAVLQLGLKYANGDITGATARCVALLEVLVQVIHDYHTPEGKSLSRDLTAHINGVINFLVDCRPLSVSMGNAIKLLKLHISQVDPSTPEQKAKESVVELITNYINEKIVFADKVLVQNAVSKVYDGDVILVYAYSHVVTQVLLAAHAAGRRFRVVVVDSRPECEGRYTLRRLLAAGMPCSAAAITGLSYIMREVTKVFLGAAAVLSNGAVVSRAGAALLAMAAAAESRPVIVCCETCKFHERVQLDSITHNELGDPHALLDLPGGARSPAAQALGKHPNFGLLNLKYDVMPAEYVAMVVTELGMVPPSSVPVILREYRQEL